jgi:hypothetical protein
VGILGVDLPRNLYQLEVEQIFRERIRLLARDRSAMVRSVKDKMNEFVERLNTAEIGDETEEQLRALGYANQISRRRLIIL